MERDDPRPHLKALFQAKVDGDLAAQQAAIAELAPIRAKMFRNAKAKIETAIAATGNDNP